MFRKTRAREYTPAEPSVGDARFVFHESLRIEWDEEHARGVPVPSASQQILTDARSKMWTDQHRPLLPWRSGCREVSVSASARIGLLCELHAPPHPRIWPPAFDGPLDMLTLDGFLALDTRGSICGAELSPDASRAAVLEWRHAAGWVAIVDVRDNRRRLLTRLGTGIAGAEKPLWSPDGAWLLLNTYRSPLLVATNDGRCIELPFPGAQLDWWPARGPSTVVALHGEPGEQRLGALSLTTWTMEDLGPLELPQQPDLPAGRRWVGHPRMSPDGQHVLVGCSFGPSADYQERCGSRDRVSLIDLSDRRVNPLVDPFVDSAAWVEREHRSWKWIHPTVPRGEPTVLAGGLVASTTPPEGPLTDTPADPDLDETLVLFRW